MRLMELCLYAISQVQCFIDNYASIMRPLKHISVMEAACLVTLFLCAVHKFSCPDHSLTYLKSASATILAQLAELIVYRGVARGHGDYAYNRRVSGFLRKTGFLGRKVK